MSDVRTIKMAHISGVLREGFDVSDDNAIFGIELDETRVLAISERTIKPRRQYFHKGERIDLLVYYEEKKWKGLQYAFAVFPHDLFKLLMSGTTTHSQFINKFKNYLSLQEDLSEEAEKTLICQNVLRDYSDDGRHPLYLDTIEELRSLYSIMKSKYSPEQRSYLERWFHSPLKKKEKLVKFLNIVPAFTFREISRNEFISEMDKHFYGMEEIKKKLADIVQAIRKNHMRHGYSILCYGNPGVGKTSMGEKLAQILGIPYKLISIQSCTSPLDLVGCNETYTDSRPGMPFEFLSREGCGSLILYDEIDKASNVSGKDGNIAMALLDLIGQEYLHDAYMELPVHNAGILWCTANDLDKVSPSLRNRFDTIFHIEDRTDEDKVSIAEEIFIPALEDEYGKIISIKRKHLRYLVSEYTSDDGARETRARLEEIWQAFSRDVPSGRGDVPIRMTRKLIDEVLGNTVAETPWLRIHRNRHLYSDETWYHIHDLHVKSLCTDDRKEKSDLNEIIKEFSEVIVSESERVEVKPRVLFDSLQKSHYGQQSVKETLISILYTQSISRRSMPLLIAGPPGTGKSSIIERAAEAMGIPFFRIACGGADAIAFKGVGRSFSSSGSGRVVKGLRRVGMNGLLLFDEIDKLGTGQTGERGADALFDLFDDTHKFTDNFWGFPVDLSGLLLVATANDLDRMDPALLSRFNVITMPGYTNYEKCVIARKYMLPALEKSYRVKVLMDDTAVRYLIDRYIFSDGVRELKHALTEIVTKTITAYAYYSIKNKKIEITENEIDQIMANITVIKQKTA